MPSKTVTVPNQVQNTKLTDRAPKRIILSFFLPLGQGEVYIYDEQYQSAGVYYLQAGEMLVLTKLEGDDTTKEWWANSSAATATPTLFVYEEFEK